MKAESLTKLSAVEKVRHYLLTEFSRPEAHEGARLPSVRDLAQQVSVSAATVHQVYRDLAREGIIETRQRSGAYLIGRPKSSASRRLTFALNTPLLDWSVTAQWSMRVTHAILHAANRGSRSTTILPLAYSEMGDGEATELLLKEIESVDGAIFIPSQISSCNDDALKLAYERAGKPYVTLNPQSVTHSRNFAAPDYFGAARELGGAWTKCGRKHIAIVISEQHTNLPSFQLRYFGLQAGIFGAGNHSPVVEVITTGKNAHDDGLLTIEQRIRSGRPLPDAIFCFSDHVARGVIQALVSHGIDVPGALSVVGGSGILVEDAEGPRLTTTTPQFEEIGESLVEMLISLAAEPGTSKAGVYLPMPYMGGGTTRDCENELLSFSMRPSQS